MEMVWVVWIRMDSMGICMDSMRKDVGLVWVYYRCSAVQCMVVRRTMMLWFQISTTSQVNKDMYNMGHMHTLCTVLVPRWPRDGRERDQRGTREGPEISERNGLIWYGMRPYRESGRGRGDDSSRMGLMSQ